MTDFLYPFLDEGPRDTDELEADLGSSARAKLAQSRALVEASLVELGSELDEVAAALAARFAAGGTLFTFGNGGSATDAAAVAALFSTPRRASALPARSLAADAAVLTALANDVGFELVFARQLSAVAGPDDIAFGLSTSGGSVNLLRAFAQARRLGMLTIGLAGYDGGAMAHEDSIDHCLVVRSDSVHRIQEAQAAVAFALWQRVQSRVSPGDADVV